MAKGKKTVKKAQPGKHAGGRPSAYKAEYCEQVEKLCRLGATDKEIADFFSVAESTINKWKKDYPEFSESLKKGKLLADANVADRLYQRAIGFAHESEEIKVIMGGKQKSKSDDTDSEDPGSAAGDHPNIVRVPILKQYPPDTVACIFWLKNRQKEKWRDKVEQGFTNGEGEDVDPIVIFQIPDNGRAKDNTTASKDNTATGRVSDAGTQQSG